MYPSSVVQTGVKSFGCENRMAQESPIQLWNRIRPWVVSASKSGAVSPIFIVLPPVSVGRNLFQIRERKSILGLRDQLAEVVEIDVDTRNNGDNRAFAGSSTVSLSDREYDG